MFNKIIASVISSVVLFACNTKEETPVASEDAVANSQAAEVVQSDPALVPVVPVSPAPAVQAVPEVTSVPLTATGVSTSSTVSTPAPVTGTVVAPTAPSVSTPVSAPVK